MDEIPYHQKKFFKRTISGYSKEKIIKYMNEFIHNNEIEFRKPLSCHLFPIRVGYYGGEHLRYEKFDECEPGRLNGEKNNIQLIESVKESIERKYGKEFFEKLKIYMESE